MCYILICQNSHMARLAQSAERKALNLVVVGSSPTVGVTYLCKGVAALDGVINQIRSSVSASLALLVRARGC